MSRRGTLVVFDCDGVLVDSEPLALRVLGETLAEAGLRLDAAALAERFLGRSLASTVRILSDELGLALDDAALLAMRQALYASFRASLQPMPHVTEALDGLRAQVCVASSSQPERVEMSLRLTGLWPWFEGKTFSAAQVARGKPAPDLFLYAAARMGYDPGGCLVVEDSPAGIEAAHRAGMAVVGFAGGSHARTPAHRAAMAGRRPDWLVEDMRALPAIVERVRVGGRGLGNG